MAGRMRWLRPSINWLLVFIPASLLAELAHQPLLTFITAALAIIPLAGLIGRAADRRRPVRGGQGFADRLDRRQSPARARPVVARRRAALRRAGVQCARRRRAHGVARPGRRRPWGAGAPRGVVVEVTDGRPRDRVRGRGGDT